MRSRLIATAVALTATASVAWQYEDEFALDQVGGRPGGGMNFGTGSKSDFRLTCAQCHVPDAGFTQRIDVSVAFTPPLGTAPDGGKGYTPNTTYGITVNMNNEHLGRLPDGGWGGHNMMAATFENAAGQFTGRLISDTGFTRTGNCPATLNATVYNTYDAGETTVTFNGCNSVCGRSRAPQGVANFPSHLTQWRFSWVAPAAGAGQAWMYYGVTDGSGEEKSTGDDTVQGVLVLEQL
jgi:hypothetical protein